MKNLNQTVEKIECLVKQIKTYKVTAKIVLQSETEHNEEIIFEKNFFSKERAEEFAKDYKFEVTKNNGYSNVITIHEHAYQLTFTNKGDDLNVDIMYTTEVDGELIHNMEGLLIYEVSDSPLLPDEAIIVTIRQINGSEIIHSIEPTRCGIGYSDLNCLDQKNNMFDLIYTSKQELLNDYENNRGIFKLGFKHEVKFFDGESDLAEYINNFKYYYKGV